MCKQYNLHFKNTLIPHLSQKNVRMLYDHLIALSAATVDNVFSISRVDEFLSD